MLEDRLDLRTKNQPSTGLRVIQRFDPKAVTRQQEPPLALIPHSESKHPAQVLNALFAELLIKMNDYFSVACGRKSMPPAFKLFSERLVVINFAVEDSHDSPVFVVYWLLSSIQIDDAEPPHSDCEVPVSKPA